MDGYCEKHHRPWDIKYVWNQWVCECPMCREEGLLDTFYDTKTTTEIMKTMTASNHT